MQAAPANDVSWNFTLHTPLSAFPAKAVKAARRQNLMPLARAALAMLERNRILQMLAFFGSSLQVDYTIEGDYLRTDFPMSTKADAELASTMFQHLQQRATQEGSPQHV